MNSPLNLKEIENLFLEVQTSQIFPDQKTMTDAIPIFPVNKIMQSYSLDREKTDFNLKKFVFQNFTFSENEKSKTPEKSGNIETDIEELWDILTRKAEQNQGTLLALPNPYIVPGGRFNEFFYWDSYFVMLGLQVSARIEMMKNIVDNCAYLITEFGFVPNASRTHFLTRSQPPFFSLMVDLLVESTKNDHLYIDYFQILEKEYHFWMNGSDDLSEGMAAKRVYKTLSGGFLNRYFDEENTPRPESYLIDLEDKKQSNSKEFYRNLRAACESGWDFSSRWFADYQNINTIQTLHILPIDLNCLLHHLEETLANTSSLLKLQEKENFYRKRAENRKQLLSDYFWDEENKIFKDYNFQTQKQTASETIATIYPLFFKLADSHQAKAVAETITQKFLFDGGLVTSTKNSGQQWDFPNAWAPFQWIGFVAMNNYGHHSLAEKIKNNWCKNVERVYENTGKMMEKYNAIDTNLVAGGGEYPNQDGFGWTNGVYMKLIKS